jgi:hypothetical protein
MSQHSLITLSNTTATRLTPNGGHSGMDITLQNANDAGYIYIGAEGVAIANYGYRIAPNTAISFELPGKDALYAISENNAMKIAVMQIDLESGS